MGDDMTQDRIGQNALGIVREHNDIGGCRNLLKGFENIPGGFRLQRVRGFMIAAQQLLTIGDKAGLDGGRTTDRFHQMRHHGIMRFEKGFQFNAFGIFPDDGDKTRPSAKGRDIPHHIARPARHLRLMGDAEDRDRRLGRDAGGTAVNKPVEHHIANDQGLYIGELVHDFQ